MPRLRLGTQDGAPGRPLRHEDALGNLHKFPRAEVNKLSDATRARSGLRLRRDRCPGEQQALEPCRAEVVRDDSSVSSHETTA